MLPRQAFRASFCVACFQEVNYKEVGDISQIKPNRIGCFFDDGELGCRNMGCINNNTLRMAFDASDLKTLDPHYAAATMDRAVVDMVFNGLDRRFCDDGSRIFSSRIRQTNGGGHETA